MHPPQPQEKTLTDPVIQEDPAASFSFTKNLLLPIGLSVLVLAIVLWATIEPDTHRRMLESNLWILGLAFLVVLMRILLGGIRLHYISDGQLSLAAGIRGGILWDFCSAVTPSAAGGGPLAAYFLARDNRLSVGSATSVMLFAILMDQMWFAVAIPIVLLAMPFYDIMPEAIGIFGAGALIVLMVLVMLWAVFFAYATLIRPQLLEAGATWVFRMPLLRRFQGRIRRVLVEMRHRSQVLRGKPVGFYVNTFLISILIWAARYGSLVLVVLAVYPNFDLVTGMLRTAAMLLIGLIIPTPGGSGGIEALYVLFLGPLMPSSVIGSTLIIWRLISYHLFIGLGVAAMVVHVYRRKSGKAGKPVG